ncbi:cilia- and flagella-associated protein 161 [Atheta coriaria]|uniref:cilia- and flagella-associated protein 161 n=1 Tax=Dalotia coriaria TaxID=877792 RepID=UPI0031F3B257
MIMDPIRCSIEIESKETPNQSCTYSLPTIIGNWENARALEEAHMALISYKKVNCQLLSSRTRAMLRNVLAPVALSPCTGGIEYNKTYQLYSPSQPSQITSTYPYEKKGLYLSGMVGEANIDKGTGLMHGCPLTASSESMPCRRNTFIFRTEIQNTNRMYYGDDLFIQINADSATPLYVQAENHTINSFGKSLQLRLSQQRDVYTHFKILHAHPKYRTDSIGMVITPSSNVIIRHVASGQNLSANASSWITTFFGVECEASCRTYRNSNRIDTAENMWQIIGHIEKTKYSTMNI